MGKRSDFKRIEKDFYPTPKKAVLPLVLHLSNGVTYAEPCCGNLDLVNHLGTLGYNCTYASDISPTSSDIFRRDALELTPEDVKDAEYIITNPPWSRDILHPIITHFRNLRPTWLLIDADWAYTKQAKPYMKYCSDIVVVGRVKWIPDSKMTGKDNCAWYQFQKEETETRFHV